MNDIELRHLRYFMKVAELLHFRKAAKALHISQPPLSRQIRDLEHRLGARLFHRGPDGVRLTEAGNVLLVESRRILDQISRSVSLTRSVAQKEARGSLTVNLTPTRLEIESCPSASTDAF